MEKTKTKRTSKRQMEALSEAAECLRTLAHPHRLRIVQLLLSGVPYSVNELSEICGITQPMTSDHLRLMQRCGLLSSEKTGRTVHYTIAEPHLGHLMACVEARFGI
jgi:DNA-binding transcriptional ArsR family regulator